MFFLNKRIYEGKKEKNFSTNYNINKKFNNCWKFNNSFQQLLNFFKLKGVVKCFF